MQEKLKELQSLCELFKTNIKQYKSSNYDEANTRTDFIDKFFELLDWDVRNTQGFAENYREVVREDKVIIQGKPKAPDYSFRIGGFRKFFLEAKKPSVNIKEDIEPAFQVRRYGYTAKLSLCILTDFEELSVYDTRIKPSKSDKASVGRIFYCTYEEYEKNFEFLYNTFSKNAIMKGSFDRYVQENKNKKGTSDVDKEFLTLIESWRESLAKNIAIRNKELDVYILNTAVQTIIDRVIFLRIAEDRNMESYGCLLESVKSENVYPIINKIFLKANDKYNSGLFKPEEWLMSLKVDDKILQNIVRYLYYPESPYEFSVLPIEILGNIYEQFLGKTIRLTSSHQAKVEEKEEVRKAGGVYYTPQYIVDYIVENTIGEKVKNLNLYEHPKLTILDPACGSGSFLVGAYSFLLNEYLKAYTNNKNLNRSLKNGLIFQVSENTYRLSIEVKQKILLNHIFGVDIDHQAVEVTKLSLLLKLMEDENTESADLLFKHSDLKLLPDLSDNIKCGNSLISSEFYKGKNLSLFGKEEMRKINVFDWEEEFPEIFKDGGFDVVIGNPPYVRQETLDDEFKNYAKKHYVTFAGTADLYIYFIEKSLSFLKKEGLYSIIVANKWLRANYGEALRKFFKQKRILEIIDFGDLPVFKKATTYPCIIKISNNEPKDFQATQIESLNFERLKDVVGKSKYIVDVSSLNDKGWSLSNNQESALLEKIKKAGIPLGEYVQGKIYYGIKTGLNEAFVIDKETKERLIQEGPKSIDVIKPFLVGKDIKRYIPLQTDKYVIFTRRGIEIKNYPAILKYLEQFKKRLMPKPGNWSENKKWEGRKPGLYEWYEIQDTIDYYQEFEKEKILWPGISSEVSSFGFDRDNLYGNDNIQLIVSSDKYLLGILNSKVSKYFLKSVCDKVQGGFYRLKIIYVKQIPIPQSTIQNSQLASLVDQMLSTQKEFHSAVTESDKKLFQQKCNLLDEQIDELVYDLYGLTEEEIKIVEKE